MQALFWSSSILRCCSDIKIIERTAAIYCTVHSIRINLALTKKVCTRYRPFLEELPQNSDGIVFADGAEVSDWAKNAVAALAARGMIAGVGGNRFAPGLQINRASVAKLLDNMVVTYVTEDNAVITGQQEGIVIVAAQNVTIKDAQLKENLIITPAASGETKLENVTAGDVILSAEGGTLTTDKTTVLEDLTVTAPKAAVSISGKAESITASQQAQGATVEVAKGAQAETVTAAAPDTQLAVSGKVNQVTVEKSAQDTKLEVAGGAKVDKLDTAADRVTVGGKGTVKDMNITDGENVSVEKGTTVDKVNNQTETPVKVGNQTVKPGTEAKPSKPSGGSSSGNGGGTVNPDPAPEIPPVRLEYTKEDQEAKPLLKDFIEDAAKQNPNKDLEITIAANVTGLSCNESGDDYNRKENFINLEGKAIGLTLIFKGNDPFDKDGLKISGNELTSIVLQDNAPYSADPAAGTTIASLTINAPKAEVQNYLTVQETTTITAVSDSTFHVMDKLLGNIEIKQGSLDMNGQTLEENKKIVVSEDAREGVTVNAPGCTVDVKASYDPPVVINDSAAVNVTGAVQNMTVNKAGTVNVTAKTVGLTVNKAGTVNVGKDHAKLNVGAVNTLNVKNTTNGITVAGTVDQAVVSAGATLGGTGKVTSMEVTGTGTVTANVTVETATMKVDDATLAGNGFQNVVIPAKTTELDVKGVVLNGNVKNVVANNTVAITGTGKAETVEVKGAGVNITVGTGSKTDTVVMTGAGSTVTADTGKVTNVQVKAQATVAAVNANVELGADTTITANVGTVTVAADNTTLNINEGFSVDKVETTKNMNVTGAGTIKNLEINSGVSNTVNVTAEGTTITTKADIGTGTGKVTVNSVETPVSKKAPKPTSLTASDPTKSGAGAKGKLNGLNDKMEYKKGSDQSWTKVEEGKTSVEVAIGDYEVRVAEVSGTAASDIVELTVNEVFDVKLAENANATVSGQPAVAKAGAEFTIQMTAKHGWGVDAVTVTGDGAPSSPEVQDNFDDTYTATITMPAKNAEIALTVSERYYVTLPKVDHASLALYQFKQGQNPQPTDKTLPAGSPPKAGDTVWLRVELDRLYNATVTVNEKPAGQGIPKDSYTFYPVTVGQSDPAIKVETFKVPFEVGSGNVNVSFDIPAVYHGSTEAVPVRLVSNGDHVENIEAVQFYVGECNDTGHTNDKGDTIWEPVDTKRIVTVEKRTIKGNNHIWTASVPAPAGGWQNGTDNKLVFKVVNTVSEKDCWLAAQTRNGHITEDITLPVYWTEDISVNNAVVTEGNDVLPVDLSDTTYTDDALTKTNALDVFSVDGNALDGATVKFGQNKKTAYIKLAAPAGAEGITLTGLKVKKEAVVGPTTAPTVSSGFSLKAITNVELTGLPEEWNGDTQGIKATDVSVTKAEWGIGTDAKKLILTLKVDDYCVYWPGLTVNRGTVTQVDYPLAFGGTVTVTVDYTVADVSTAEGLAAAAAGPEDADQLAAGQYTWNVTGSSWTSVTAP